LSSIAVDERPHVAVRPLALPAEHGGWSFLLEPAALGLLVAPSWAGGAIAMGAIAAFLARHPLKLAGQDYLRGRRYPRTLVCEQLAASYGLVALLLFALAPMSALVALAAAVPFAGAQFVFDVRNRGRALMPEMAGVIGSGAIAMSIAIAGGRPLAIAAALWLLVALRAVPSILYVRATLRGGSRPAMLIAHAAAVAIAAMVHPLTAIPFGGLLVRALPRTDARAKTIGLREVAYGTATILLIALLLPR
jgi:hypothetical protein